jgi:integrase
VKRGWLAASPFQLDLQDLAERAGRTAERPRILSVEQCEALWKAAAELGQGKMLPYLQLALFCFLRHGEAVRVTRADINLDRGILRADSRKVGTVSSRTVNIPENILPYLGKLHSVYFSKRLWNAIRLRAKVLDIWQENLLRHTGISYCYQQLSARADELKLNAESVIAAVCRQAANTPDTAFRHYVNLTEPGAYLKFYQIGICQ